jgi:hypothetical protein
MTPSTISITAPTPTNVAVVPATAGNVPIYGRSKTGGFSETKPAVRKSGPATQKAPAAVSPNPTRHTAPHAPPPLPPGASVHAKRAARIQARGATAKPPHMPGHLEQAPSHPKLNLTGNAIAPTKGQ